MRSRCVTRCLGLVFVPGLLAGCWEQKGLDDLRRFQSDAKAEIQAEIEPLPVMLPPARFSYTARSERDPFSLLNVIAREDSDTINEQPAPDPNRPREPLEAFSLDSLEMVGSLARDGSISGVVRAPDKSIHRVELGQYLGENSGKVVQITESQILLAEATRAPNGKWVTTQAVLSLEE